MGIFEESFLQTTFLTVNSDVTKQKNNDELSLEVEAITNFQKLHYKNEVRSISKFTQSKLYKNNYK